MFLLNITFIYILFIFNAIKFNYLAEIDSDKCFL